MLNFYKWRFFSPNIVCRRSAIGTQSTKLRRNKTKTKKKRINNTEINANKWTTVISFSFLPLPSLFVFHTFYFTLKKNDTKEPNIFRWNAMWPTSKTSVFLHIIFAWKLDWMLEKCWWHWHNDNNACTCSFLLCTRNIMRIFCLPLSRNTPHTNSMAFFFALLFRFSLCGFVYCALCTLNLSPAQCFCFFFLFAFQKRSNAPSSSALVGGQQIIVTSIGISISILRSFKWHFFFSPVRWFSRFLLPFANNAQKITKDVHISAMFINVVLKMCNLLELSMIALKCAHHCVLGFIVTL